MLDLPGVYIGCGNGRNYVPLVDRGLDLVGLDVSLAAIRQLTARVPDLAPGRVMGVRVNAVGTEIDFDHEVVEEGEGSGLTVRYVQGPKRGLLVHFFDCLELEALFTHRLDVDLPVRRDRTRRPRPGSGYWSQWRESGCEPIARGRARDALRRLLFLRAGVP